MGAGAPSVENSHPHVSDADAEFTVVHNGILTNYKLLKEFLVSEFSILCLKDMLCAHAAS